MRAAGRRAVNGGIIAMMRWGWLGVCLLSWGCAGRDDVAATQQSSCEFELAVPLPSVARLDILIQFDPSVRALVPDYEDRLRSVGALLELVSSALHVAVADAEHAENCTRDGSQFLSWRPRPDAPAVANFDGSFGDALVCLVNSVGYLAIGDWLYGGLRIPGFRDGEFYGLVLINASPMLLPDDTLFTSILGTPESAAAWFGDVPQGPHVDFQALDSDWGDALSFLVGELAHLRGAPCIRGPVLSPAACVVTETDPSGNETLLRYCPDRSGPRPCWYDEPSSPYCLPEASFGYHVLRDEYAPWPTFDDVRCPLACP
jgi:hypothetical protein